MATAKKKKPAKKKEKLIPPDLKRCQAESRPEWSFMSFGPKPPLVRCKRKPTHIVIEKKEKGKQQGSMSLCPKCLEVCLGQMPGLTVKAID